MKIRILGLLSFLLIFSACSDDEGTTDVGPISEANYFPLATDNYWSYNYTAEQEGYEDINDTDHMYISQNNGGIYQMEAEYPVYGVMTNLFNGSSLTKQDYKLLFSGDFNFVLDSQNSFTIPLEDVVVYDASANSGETLFSESNSISETLNEIPLTIDYTIQTLEDGYLNSFEVEDVVYEDVLSSKFVVTLKISINILGSGVPILDTQDVVVGTNYYAADVGMIYSDVVFEYQLDDFSGLPVEIPMEESAYIHSTQSLTSYIAVED